jgi:hypothetical protein
LRDLRNPETGFISSLQGEERARYYLWYRKYVLLRRAAWIVGGIQSAFVLALVEVRGMAAVLTKVLPFGLLLFVGLLIWGPVLDCPRCGQTFLTNNEYGAKHECRNYGLTLRQLSSIAKPRDIDSLRGFR